VDDDWSSRFFYSEFFVFAKAMHTTPLGTACAVWTRIGAFRAVVVGIYFFNGPLSLLRGADSTSCIGGWAETCLSLRRIGLEKPRFVVVIFYRKCNKPKRERN
jgi:hypothetical protein